MPNYGAIAEGLTSIYDIGTGISQGIQAKKLQSGLSRPTYTPPSAAQMALENAKIMALRSRFPGQDAAEQRIGATTSGAIRSAKEGASSSADLLGAISGIAGSAQNANVDLGVKSGEFQNQNQLALNQALMSYAPYQDKAFEFNQANPYEEKAAAIRALKGAGKTNIEQGIGNAGKAAMSAFSLPIPV